MQIWVDADACPGAIKDILYRAANRAEIRLTLIANQMLRVPPSPWIRALQVPSGFDVADARIAQEAQAASSWPARHQVDRHPVVDGYSWLGLRNGTGVCGGFQMLGRRLIDGVESGIDEMPGLGLLDCETVFAREKVTTQVQATVVSQAHGLLAGCSGLAVEGYEIHMGETERAAGVTPFTRLSRRNRAEVSIEEGAISQDGLVAGTYIHMYFLPQVKANLSH